MKMVKITSLEDKTEVPGLKIKGENAEKQEKQVNQSIQDKDSFTELSSLPSEDPINLQGTYKTNQKEMVPELSGHHYPKGQGHTNKV
jgi:hypothetical protein